MNVCFLNFRAIFQDATSNEGTGMLVSEGNLVLHIKKVGINVPLISNLR